eukprot:7691106-Lingulodinium_polyedra.AAC.1
MWPSGDPRRRPPATTPRPSSAASSRRWPRISAPWARVSRRRTPQPSRGRGLFLRRAGGFGDRAQCQE